MAALKIRSHEQICNAYATGSMSQLQAVKSAGLHPGSTGRIFARADVKARVAELRGQRLLLFPADGLVSRGLMVTEVLNNIRAARDGGNYAASNMALRALLMLGGITTDPDNPVKPLDEAPARLAAHARRTATKEQRALKDRTDCDEDMREEDDGSSANDRATPDISEIADMAGGFDNGPGDLVEEEQVESALGETESGLPEVDGDERPEPTAEGAPPVRRDEASGIPQTALISGT